MRTYVSQSKNFSGKCPIEIRKRRVKRLLYTTIVPNCFLKMLTLRQGLFENIFNLVKFSKIFRLSFSGFLHSRRDDGSNAISLRSE